MKSLCVLVVAVFFLSANRLPAPIIEQGPTPATTVEPTTKPKRTSRKSPTSSPEQSAKAGSRAEVPTKKSSEISTRPTTGSKSATAVPFVSGESGGVQSDRNHVPYIGGEGSVAVINLDTKLNTTATLNWTGFTGVALYRTIYISEAPSSPNWMESAHTLATIGAWKTSVVIHGLPLGTYYFAIGKQGKLSNVFRVAVTPGK